MTDGFERKRDAQDSPEALLVAHWFEEKSIAQVQHLTAGTKIIELGRPLACLWFLRDGVAEVRMPDGTVIRVSGPTVFGEVGFLTGSSAMADVLVLKDAEAVKCSFDALRDWAAGDALRAIWLYEQLAKVASQRLSGNYHRRYCALVAHDGRKDALIRFVGEHKEFFASQHLVATATTAGRLEDTWELIVARTVLSGPKGGDQEIGGLISRGVVDAVFFFRDPLWAQPHQADVNALVRVCEVANVPIATNVRTATLMLAGLLQELHRT